MPEAAIALGSNLPSEFGGPGENLDEAARRVRDLGRVIVVSSYFQTAPEINVNQPDFVNAALLLETELAPLDLMRALLAIETEMGRVRTGIPPKGPRRIDLDLIFFDDAVIASEQLVLPHPGVAARRFVLAPLAEIAPEWIDPRSGLTVRQLLAALESQRAM